MNPYKVYVMLGFHTSFYHSWRGDTPDEAGFGKDIRMVRLILDILERAEREGKPVRSYWDFDVYWTLQEIISHHAPDLIPRIRQRVQVGLDEIVLGPYNNGANHAATPEELRAAIAYAIENPFGSGLKQVFGRVAPIYRPQESMYTCGQNAFFLEQGIQALVLYYASIPFNTFGAFVPALPPEQRYNPLWLRAESNEAPIAMLPCISPPDLIEAVCLESLLLRLHDLQESSQVRADMVIHLNFDADVETWLPVRIPRIFAWFPNTGGLEEYIRVVNRYPWAEFTVPSDYLQSHPPRGEVLVRQDLADGGFDGSYSWAEKFSSLMNWTMLERSRLSSYRATALGLRVPSGAASAIQERLWEGEGSSFFQRLVGLSTTHFGMSTPIINEERQIKAEAILGNAESIAREAEREAACLLRRALEGSGVLYEFEVFNFRRGMDAPPQPVRCLVRVPLILPEAIRSLRMANEAGVETPASLVNVQPLPGGRLAGEVLFALGLEGEEHRSFRVLPAPDSSGSTVQTGNRVHNAWLDLRFSPRSGIASFGYQGMEIGRDGFLQPFITYRVGKRPVVHSPGEYTFVELAGETWNGLHRARLATSITMQTPQGPATSRFQYTFTLFDELPYLLVDVEAHFASTPAQDLIRSLNQKMKSQVDFAWVEIAPFQLLPNLIASTSQPLRIWRHNYLGISCFYDLDYGRINPQNCNLDSFNHQAAAGWIAVSNLQAGLLLAENTSGLASMAFCPMRLREREGLQHLSLNPFGTYFGSQLSYTHLGGNGIGARFTQALSGALKPNAPSFNGQDLRFSLLIAPYTGDQPPPQLQADALAFFYPPGVFYHRTPPEVDAILDDELRQYIETAGQTSILPSTGRVEPGKSQPATEKASLISELSGVPLGAMTRLVGYSLAAVLRARLRRDG